MTKKTLIGSLVLAFGLCGAAWAAEAAVTPTLEVPAVSDPLPALPEVANFTPAAPEDPEEPLLFPGQEMQPRTCDGSHFCCPNLTDQECFNQCYPACGLNGVCNTQTKNCICTDMF